MSDALLPIATNPVSIEQATDPAQFVVVACENAKHWLAQAIERGEIDPMIEMKSQAEAIRIYTQQRQIGHDAEMAAAEIVRRAERGIGLAVKAGQERGEIADPHARSTWRNQHGGGQRHDVAPPSPETFFANHGERTDAYVMAEADDTTFEEIIDQAKDEGNLSRANIVRKVKDEPSPLKSREAIKARKRRMVELAIAGHTSGQIAKDLGVSPETVRTYALDEGVEIPADRHTSRARHIDPNRVIEETVIGVDSHTTALSLLEGRWDDVDADRAMGWAGTLGQSMKQLRDLHRELLRRAINGTDD